MEFYNDNGIKRRADYCKERPNPNAFNKETVEASLIAHRGEFWDEPKRLRWVYKKENGYPFDFISDTYFKL